MEADDIRDLFAAFGPVDVRRLFGGHGIYADGLMIALQVRGVLYLKADEDFAAALSARGSQPFVYTTAKGERTVGSYWRVPEAAMDDEEDLATLARRALAIARAGEKPKPSRRKRPRPA